MPPVQAPSTGRARGDGVIRSVTGFHLDPDGDWVAEVCCGHAQHVRHQPPFQQRPWVLDPIGRAGRVGTPIDCPLCERAELPPGLAVTGRAGPWDADSLPAELGAAGCAPPGRWGRLRVHSGSIGFQFAPGPSGPAPVVRLEAGSCQAIPPGRAYRLLPRGPALIELEYLGQSGPAGSGRACAADP